MPKTTKNDQSLIAHAKASATAFEKIETLKKALDREQRQHAKLKATREDTVAAIRRGVSDAIMTLEFDPIKPPAADTGHGKEEVAVATLADWQLGKRTESYSTKICEERINLFGDKVIELTNIQRKDHPVRKIHVWALGDIVEGELIFPGQAHLIDSSLYAQAIKDGPRIMINFLRKMLSNFDEVHFVGVIGNHGALGGSNRREYNGETNADRMLYSIVQQVMEASSESRVTFDIPAGPYERNWYAVDHIGKYSSLLIHGDQFRGRTGIPVAAMVKKIALWSMGGIPDRYIDVAFGHYHQPTRVTINTATARCAGSPESSNAWASEGLAAVGRPSQPLMFVCPDKGIVTAEYQVWLGPKIKQRG